MSFNREKDLLRKQRYNRSEKGKLMKRLWKAKKLNEPGYRDELSAKTRAYKNRPEVAESRRQYERNKYATDPNFRLEERCRGLIGCALRRAGSSKSIKTIALIGCSINDLRTHIESKFSDGMSVDNYGLWHIDHIRPCSSFDLTDPEQQKQCFHFTNLQPLWAIDNIIKSDNW